MWIKKYAHYCRFPLHYVPLSQSKSPQFCRKAPSVRQRRPMLVSSLKPPVGFLPSNYRLNRPSGNGPVSAILRVNGKASKSTTLQVHISRLLLLHYTYYWMLFFLLYLIYCLDREISLSIYAGNFCKFL